MIFHRIQHNIASRYSRHLSRLYAVNPIGREPTTELGLNRATLRVFSPEFDKSFPNRECIDVG